MLYIYAFINFLKDKYMLAAKINASYTNEERQQECYLLHAIFYMLSFCGDQQFLVVYSNRKQYTGRKDNMDLRSKYNGKNDQSKEEFKEKAHLQELDRKHDTNRTWLIFRPSIKKN